jgi:Fibronectin type III domain
MSVDDDKYLESTTMKRNFVWGTAVCAATTILYGCGGGWGELDSTNASAQVSFAAPIFNGGSPILSYIARCTSSDGGVAGSASELASPVTVTGLSNGKSYSCTVAAANAAGTGPISPASSSFRLPTELEP